MTLPGSLTVTLKSSAVSNVCHCSNNLLPATSGSLLLVDRLSIAILVSVVCISRILSEFSESVANNQYKV